MICLNLNSHRIVKVSCKSHTIVLFRSIQYYSRVSASDAYTTNINVFSGQILCIYVFIVLYNIFDLGLLYFSLCFVMMYCE